MTHLLRTSSCLLLSVVLLWGASAPATTAQQTRTLTIQDGIISVDGHQLQSDQIPDDLDLEGVTAQYEFVGIQDPVIELNGRLFSVQNGLEPVSEEEVDSRESSVILQEISARSLPSQTARTEESPQRQYMNEVQKANRKLYRRLLRERSMEQKAQNLARLIRMMPADSDERQAKVDTLRTLLNEIFDLKQENRRQEIDGLKRDIQELQRRLQKRRQMRSRMIDDRLQHLLGTTAK